MVICIDGSVNLILTLRYVINILNQFLKMLFTTVIFTGSYHQSTLFYPLFMY